MTSSAPCDHPYPSLGEHWRHRFGERVQRISLNPGHSCPNRDGTVGWDGCAFCDPASFSPPAGDVRPISEQLASGAARLAERRGVRRFAAYFQPGTNTHAPLEALRRDWDAAARTPGVVALCVGTRPDSVPDPVLDLLASYRTRLEVWLELGLQSARGLTLAKLGRGHTAADFVDASTRARRRGLLVCAHVILGLPWETDEDEGSTADFLRGLGVDGVKLHHLAVVRGTRLEEEWRQGAMELLTEEAYAARAVAFLRRLPPNTVVHRLVGDSAPERLLAPRYNKGRVAQEIRARLAGPALQVE